MAAMASELSRTGLGDAEIDDARNVRPSSALARLDGVGIGQR
jgi:hypothetical protein